MSAVTKLATVDVVPPERVAEITVAAVDLIGVTTADSIESAADSVDAEAKKLSDDLSKLSTAVREHTRIAAQKVSAFSLMVTSMRDTVSGLEHQITGEVIRSE